jgi:hypothetical protein
MEKITNQEEAFGVIRRFQEAIQDKLGSVKNTEFVLGFIPHEEATVLLCAPRGFSMCDQATHERLKFEGFSVEDAIQGFIQFFDGGGKMEVNCDENNYQFSAIVSFEEDWVIEKAHIGFYEYHGSLDD